MSRISDIASKLKQKTEAEKQSSGSLNPTRFEKDLVSALNGIDSLSGYQSSYSKIIAEKCAISLKKQVGAVKRSYAVGKDQSGAGNAVLSPIYRRFMCREGRCNGDPKSDIIVLSQMNGKMRASMKKHGEAQIATAQVGEANAVISAALGASKEIPTLIRSILSQTLSKEYYYSIRNRYAAENGENPEAFDAMLSSITGLTTSASVPSSKDLKEFSKFLKEIGIKDKITEGLREYMNSPSVQKRIFKEFASGEKRYIKSEADRSADWFMAWGENGKIDLMEIDELVESKFGSFRMNIRDRGNESGGSIRLSIRDSSEYSEIEKYLSEEFEMYCLTEGILDNTVSIMRTAGKAVASLYKSFIAAVKSLLLVVAALFADGVSSLFEFFGLETTDMSYSW